MILFHSARADDAFALFVNLNFPPLDSLLAFFTVAAKAKSLLARLSLLIALVAVETFDSKQMIVC
jgi:hypothetical protein